MPSKLWPGLKHKAFQICIHWHQYYNYLKGLMMGEAGFEIGVHPFPHLLKNLLAVFRAHLLHKSRSQSQPQHIPNQHWSNRQYWTSVPRGQAKINSSSLMHGGGANYFQIFSNFTNIWENRQNRYNQLLIFLSHSNAQQNFSQDARLKLPFSHLPFSLHEFQNKRS